MTHQERCIEYLSERRSTYEFRCKRYRGVAERLEALGLQAEDSITDVGAGSQDFRRFMRERGWTGGYFPIDGSIDGTDLNVWTPKQRTAYFVCIEVLEHVYDPFRLMRVMKCCARKGVAATTPNSAQVDTLGMDETHVYPLFWYDFLQHGWRAEIREFFGKPEDSILAWASAA